MKKNNYPRIFITGPTCSGKTALSLYLSSQFQYEIINCDSMQLYQGADIMTAKATKQEQAKTPHYLLDILPIHEKCTRNQFFQQAEQAITEIESKNKGIIAVGGTNYYIESLLFDLDIKDWGEDELSWEQIKEALKDKLNNKEQITPIEALEIIDPEMAANRSFTK